MDDKLQKSIDRAIALLKTPKKYENYISIKIVPLGIDCCCSHCLPETWRKINQYIAPCGPVGHEGDALIKKNKNEFVFESHETGLEFIVLIDIIKKSADCLKSIIELITVSIKALSQEKRKQPFRMKIAKRQIIRGVVDEENLIEIDIPLTKDIEKQLLKKLKKLVNKKHNRKTMESNSEIVIYKNPDGNIKIDVRLEDETVWVSQAHMCELFDKNKRTISEHIRNIFEEGELQEESVVRKFRTTAVDSKNYDVKYYNLDVIISVGYRVKSIQGTQFRIWATKRLKEYIIKGFALNDDRFKTGNSMNYFNELQERLREIRLSERFFYQKIKDIYSTSIDYDLKDEKTIAFFKVVQNKLLWAISTHTAAELVYRRADASLPLLGMQSYDKDSVGKISRNDVSIAKNYLNEEEIKLLGLLVEQYLAFAETMAQQHTLMYMKDWIGRLDNILQMNGRKLLTHAGKISHQMAIEKSN